MLSDSRHSISEGGSWSDGQISRIDRRIMDYMAPKASESFIHDVKLGKMLPDQSTFSPDSEMTRCSSSFSSITSNDTPNSKSSMELVKEITSLETEILHLESYILSLYRTAFRQHVGSLHTRKSPLEYKVESQLHPVPDQLLLKKVNSVALLSGHHVSGIILGLLVLFLDRPDRLSEDIIRCISSIYCKLGDQNQSQSGPLVSSASIMASMGTNCIPNISDTSSPYRNEEARWDGKRNNIKEEGGQHVEMVEVLKISVDDDGFNYSAGMLKKFRTLVKKLENVDPQKMKREQKLVFWINIHNALVMHAYLAYGTHNNTKSDSILKATYNIGGHSINAYTIQISILRIKSHFRESWLHSLLSPGRKLKTEHNKHIYAIEYPEPLVHFALSLGAFSDPAVRIYNAKNIFQDLRLAKQEFIQSTVYMNKETRIYLPKILYYFAKDMALSMSSLLEIVSSCLSESQRKVMKTSIKDKPEKYVYWLSQSCIFRYVIHGDKVEGRLSA
ncbi:hypothetical protein SSX86_017868 [Deinandra increscens subsp. villosa]|uniref:DUF547 domain-containing protein n=1 Tax=Deinandra increscens subsp. villosa TaxID=3103831 RepID=A0AAP0CXN6_9ASTR